MKKFESEIDNFFVAMGLSFPTNEEELHCFNSIYSDVTFNCNEVAINPAKIVDLIRTPMQITRIDYHKRTVLAAEIIFQLKDEWTLGHVKLQKLLYLCQNVAKMPLHTNFLKQAMGPYDPSLMRSLDKQLREHKWFEFTNQSSGLKYKSLINAGGHKVWFDRYYSEYADKIDFLINTFRKSKTVEVELIATIYACWIDILNSKEIFSDLLIIKKVYGWSPDKAKFSELEIVNGIKYMIELDIYPVNQSLN